MDNSFAMRPAYQDYLEVLSETLTLVTKLESDLPETLNAARSSLAALSQAITAYNQAEVPHVFGTGHQLMRQSLVTEEVVFERMVNAYQSEDAEIILQSRRIYESAGALREQALAEIKAALQHIMESP